MRQHFLQKKRENQKTGLIFSKRFRVISHFYHLPSLPFCHHGEGVDYLVFVEYDTVGKVLDRGTCWSDDKDAAFTSRSTSPQHDFIVIRRQ